MADHRSALLRIIEPLTKSGRFGVKAIGHRIVHGGEYFQEAVIVTEDVIEKIEEQAIAERGASAISAVCSMPKGSRRELVAREISGYGQSDAKVRRLIPSIF